MRLQQGESYDESANQEVTALATTPKRKVPIKWIIIFVAVVVVVLVIVIGAAIVGPSDKKDPPVEELPTDDIIVSGDDLFWDPEDVYIFQYTEAEKAALRELGYTGSDIEAFESAMIAADVKIAEGEAALEAKMQEVLDRLSDTASPEYQELLAMTWLGGEAIPADAFANYTSAWHGNVVTYNADYVKVPAHGNQLWLKVTLEDGSCSFMEVNPEQYTRLKESGNIIVSYTVVTYNGYDYAINLKEVTVGG